MTSEKPDWFKMNPAQLLQDGLVDAMTTLEFGIAMRLLCRQWIDGGLVDDTTILARQARVTLSEMESAWPLIARFFPEIEDGKRANRFMWVEREAVLNGLKAKQDAGRAAALRQWEGRRAAKGKVDDGARESMASPMGHP